VRRDDRNRLEHILEATKEAIHFSDGKNRADLDTDKQLARALERVVEIIGEAATNVSPETRRNFPEIPWNQMRGMRNRLVHAYYNINLDYLWDTVSGELPGLLKVIRDILAEDEQTE